MKAVETVDSSRALDPVQLTDHLLALMGAPQALPTLRTEDAPRPYRRFLDALGVAVYTADADGRITYFNDAAANFWGRRPALGEEWCGSWRLFWTDGRPMPHDECPMAMCLREDRVVRGYEAIAERPDGSRVTFVPYPTPLHDDSGRLIGAVNVLVDVTERRQAEEALRATAQALAASNTVKDEFLGLVSHELRTPVTTIFGNARLLRDRGPRLAPGDRDSMVADIAGEAERLLGMIENLLLLTRLEAGAAIELEPHALNRVVHGIVSAHRTRHPGRRFVVRTPRDQLIVEADAAYLDVLLGNLLSNAVKYSPPGSSIAVTVTERDQQAEVTVRDRGIGIAAADAEKIFSPFYRADGARRLSNGVGIGLTVCRRLAESLGGRVWFAPRRGGGAEFGFALPLASERQVRQ